MKCRDLSFYMCKFFNDTLTEYEKKELALHLSICNKCKEYTGVILPTFVCMDKYLKQDVINDDISDWIINEIQKNEEVPKVTLCTLKPSTVF